ncbi:MAG: S41 family peptidase [Rhodothermales bacterium]
MNFRKHTRTRNTDAEDSPSKQAPAATRPRLRTRRTTVLAAVALIGLAAFRTVDDDLFKLRKNFEIFGALYEQLILGYVDDLDSDRTMHRAISAMLADLDPYTVFSDQSQQVTYAAARGGYVSAGLNLTMINGQLTVIEPAGSASAYKQGIRIGDVVVEIAGRDADGMTIGDAATLLSGEPGTTVAVSVRREGTADPIPFVLTREQDTPSSIELAEFLDGDEGRGIGYIKLASFQMNSHREFRRALNDLNDTGNLKAVVVDLRDNLGGYVDAAVAIAEMFVPRGSTVLTMRGRTPETFREYKTSLDPIVGDIPVVVLMNELSASASEILAGAIQDLDRGVIVGTTSFGKGLVQTVQQLPYNSALKLTIARYYTPSGRSIQAIDYRAHDGSPLPVPDSLRTTYATANGRTVKDGRGIEPDLTSREREPSEIEQALLRQSAFFFFANNYAGSHATLAPDYQVDDATWSAFRSWLDGQDFAWRSESDEAIEALRESLAEAGYDADSALTELEKKVRQEKGRDLDRFRESIERELREEIGSRYFDGEALVRFGLGSDPDLDAAKQLLASRNQYQQLLSPQ